MKVGELFAEMRMDFKPFDRDERLAKARVTTLGGTLSGILKNAFSFTLGMGLFQGVKSLGGLAKDFVLTAGRTETLDVALQAVARSTGTSVRALLQERNALMDLGIAEQEASQILTRFMQAQIDTADAAKLARVAQDSAVVAGENSSQAAAKMTEAIAKQRPELLSAYGMTRNLNDIFGDYAKTIGKAASQLSETERKQAMLSYILKEGEKVAGAYERSMGSAFKKLGSLTRYVDTFKTAVARPLALPAFGVVIDAVTDAFKRGIAWAETNKAALQAWGQAVKHSVISVWNAVSGFARSVAANWSVVGPLTAWVVKGFLAFKAATLAVSAASVAIKTFTMINLAMRGSLVAGTGALKLLSDIILYYQVITAEATVVTVGFTGVLHGLRAALQAVHTAIGPVGWALLAITTILTGGIVAWSKYQSSLLKASQAKYAEQIKKSQEQMADSTKKATKSTEDQAEALGELGKASQKNLQSFDEVHTLMDDMGDVPGLDIPGMDVATPEIDAFDDLFDGMFDGFEQPAASFKGFVDWIVDGVKEKFSNFKTWLGTTWVAGFWDGVKNTWSGFKEWAGSFWEGTKVTWGNFKGWVAGWAVPLWDGVKETWGNFKEFAANMWDGAKEKWSGFKEFAGTTWDGIKATVQEKWNTLKTEAPIVWDNIKTTIAAKWNELRTNAPIVWGNVKDTISTKWEELKVAAPLAWGSIKDSVAAKWAELRTSAPVVWEGIRSEISTRWNALKTEAPITWENIKQSIVDRFNVAKTSVIEAARNMRDNVPKSWDEMLGRLNAAKDAVRKAIIEPFAKAKETVLGIIDDAKDWGKNLMSNITDGIKSKVNSVKTAVSNAASAVKNFLGFSSPTREGPGRDADRWAPNLMKMYSRGILANSGLIQSAANEAAKGLAAMNAFNVAPAFAGAGSAFSSPSMSAAGLAQGSASGDMTFIVKIGEDTFIEKVISGINRKSRASGETLITV